MFAAIITVYLKMKKVIICHILWWLFGLDLNFKFKNLCLIGFLFKYNLQLLQFLMLKKATNPLQYKTKNNIIPLKRSMQNCKM